MAGAPSMRRSVVAAALAVVALLAAATAAAACPKTTLGAVEAEVMCPVCGTSLALATEAPQAIRQRALIERLIDRCRSKEEIKEVLAAQFGDSVLALPEPKGFNAAAYLVPIFAALAAIAALIAAARRWRRRSTPASPAAPELGEESARRLDADLERYDL